MQARPVPQKPKFKLKQFAVSGNYATNKFVYQSNDGSCKVYCICNQFNLNKSRKCSRCGQSYHSCVIYKTENVKNWQCLHCESIYMDPIYCPQAILLETFFKTQPITQYGNLIEFVFYLNQQQIKKPVQIRGLQDGRPGLAWPMQGQFYVNKEQNPEPIIDIKPLLKNSNRKHRKQQALFIPQDKLMPGKNILTFSIPKINGTLYESKYQIQVKGIYFLGIYSINKLSREQLINKTFKTSKMQKSASLQFLKQSSGFGQLSVQKTVISLQCPYMKSRIKIPVRGKQCSHYTCICLQTLIQTRIGMSSRQWLCPICSSPINQPVIDMFIFSILNDGSAGIKVALDVQGNYQWMSFEEDNLSLSSDSFDRVATKPINKQIEVKDVEPPQPIKQDKIVPNPPVNKVPQKIIQAINIDDDEPTPPPPPILPVIRPTVTPINPINTQTPSSVASKSVKPFSRQSLASKSVPPPGRLEIMIPEQVQVQSKKRKKQALKQALKESLKQKQKKQANQTLFVRENPRKQQFYITDIRQMLFKPINFNEFGRKYFNLEYNRSKINDDLRTIFKEVI